MMKYVRQRKNTIPVLVSLFFVLLALAACSPKEAPSAEQPVEPSATPAVGSAPEVSATPEVSVVPEVTPEPTPEPEQSAAPDLSKPTKEEYIERHMTDAELAAIKKADPKTLQEEISTVGDAVAFLDQFSPMGFRRSGENFNLSIDFLLDLHRRPEATFNQTYTSFAAWCLSDDYDGVQIIACVYENNRKASGTTALLLPTQNGYAIYSPYVRASRLTAGDYTAVKETEVSSMEDLKNAIRLEWENPIPFQIFLADAGQRDLRFLLDEYAQQGFVAAGQAELVYGMSDAEKAELKEAEKQERIRAAWENLQNHWGDYGMPDNFNPTLSKSQVEALIGKDADTVAEGLKTVGDVLYYLALSGYYTTDGDIKVWEDGACWSFNESPRTVFANNAGNCGGTAGFVPFLLDGDYDEAGCLTMALAVEIGGGHVISYIQDGDTCYVFDPRGIVDFNYTWNGGLSTGADVVEAGRRWRENVDPSYKRIIAYPTIDGDLPGMGIGKDGYLPEQYRDRITIVYEAKEEGYSFAWRAMSDEALEGFLEHRNP